MARSSGYHKDILHRVVVLYAEFKSDTEINQTIKDEYGVQLPRKYALGYIGSVGSNVHMKMLSLRESYCKGVMEMPIAQKAVRLGRLEKVYQENKDSLDRDSKALAVRALAEARTEVEGSKVIQFFQFNKFEGKTDDELLALRDKLLGELRRLNPRRGDGHAVVSLEAVGEPGSGTYGPAEASPDSLLRSTPDTILLPHLHEEDESLFRGEPVW